MWQIRMRVIETQLITGPRRRDSDIIPLWLCHLYKPVRDTTNASTSTRIRCATCTAGGSETESLTSEPRPHGKVMVIYPQQLLRLCTPGFSHIWTPLEHVAGGYFWGKQQFESSFLNHEIERFIGLWAVFSINLFVRLLDFKWSIQCYFTQVELLSSYLKKHRCPSFVSGN